MFISKVYKAIEERIRFYNGNIKLLNITVDGKPVKDVVVSDNGRTINIISEVPEVKKVAPKVTPKPKVKTLEDKVPGIKASDFE